jgi:hypothetical protein
VSADAFGWLRRSDDLVGDPAALRRRLDEDGYLFVPDLLDRDEVFAARMALLRRAEAAGALDPAHPLEHGCCARGSPMSVSRQGDPASMPELVAVLRGKRMLGFFASLLGADVRSYDFMWLRHQPRMDGVEPHCDLVFMGRGTPDVLTCWTPFGDIALGAAGSCCWRTPTARRRSASLTI